MLLNTSVNIFFFLKYIEIYEESLAMVKENVKLCN